jgi:hypothetical protein
VYYRIINSVALVQYDAGHLYTVKITTGHRVSWNPTAAGAIDHYFTNKIYYCKSQPRLVGSQVLFQQCNKRTRNSMTNFLFSDQYRIPRFQIRWYDIDRYKLYIILYI